MQCDEENESGGGTVGSKLPTGSGLNQFSLFANGAFSHKKRLLTLSHLLSIIYWKTLSAADAHLVVLFYGSVPGFCFVLVHLFEHGRLWIGFLALQKIQQTLLTILNIC